MWWGALCKALLVGMGRSKANHKAKLGPCVAETHGGPGQGGPSTLLRVLRGLCVP